MSVQTEFFLRLTRAGGMRLVGTRVRTVRLNGVEVTRDMAHLIEDTMASGDDWDIANLLLQLFSVIEENGWSDSSKRQALKINGWFASNGEESCDAVVTVRYKRALGSGRGVSGGATSES